jgi:PTS system nitrogen regulatory IIA component
MADARPSGVHDGTPFAETLDHAEVRCVGLRADCARRAQWQLAMLAVERHPELSAKRVYRALRQREREATTAIGGGIAIPHARVAGLSQPEVVLGLLQDAVPYESPDGQPVRMMALVVSDPLRPDDHLAALSRVARMLIDRA